MPKICIFNLVFKFISLRHDAIFHLLYFVNADCSVSRTELLVISFLILYTYSYILLLRLIKFCDCLPRNLNIKVMLCIRTFRREIFATTTSSFHSGNELFINNSLHRIREPLQHWIVLCKKTVIKHIYSDSRKIFQQNHNII